MKAHIENKASSIDNYMSITDGTVYGRMQYTSDMLSGEIHFKASVDLVCNGDTREFELKSVNLDNASIKAHVSEQMTTDEHDAIRNQFVENELDEVAIKHITTTINDNKEYLIDNHHDFNIDCRNHLDRMEYQNTGVGGYTWMAKDEDDQEALLEDPHNSDVPVFKVEFDVDYTLEFFDGRALELIMKDFIVNDIKVTEWIGNDEFDVEITEAEKKAIGLRVIAAIEDNYIEAEYYMCEALGGNPIDE